MSQQAMHQPNQGDNYEWDSEGQNRGGSSGLYITLGSSDVVARTPSWNKSETVFRPYPRPVNPLDPNSPFEAGRVVLSDGSTRASNWIRRYSCAWKIGNPSTTFLIPRPAGSPVYDPNGSPLGVLYRAIYNAVQKSQANPEWPTLIMKSPGKGQQLNLPKRLYLAQGALFRHNNKDFFNDKEPLGVGKNPPLMLVISGGAGDDIMAALSEQKPEWRPGSNPADFEARYTHGDPVALTSGRFFSFYEKGSAPANRYGSQPVQPMVGDGFGGFSGGGQRGDNRFGFDISIHPTFNNWPASLFSDPQQAAMVRSKWREWSQVLYLPTEAEQAAILANCFPLSAIMYAFEGHRDWLSKEIRQRAAAAVSAPVPAGVPRGAGYVSNAGYQQHSQQYPQAPDFGPGYPGQYPQSPLPQPGFVPPPVNQPGMDPTAPWDGANTAPPWGGQPSKMDPVVPQGAVPHTKAATAAVDAAFPAAVPSVDQSRGVTNANTAATIARLNKTRKDLKKALAPKEEEPAAPV